MLKVKVNDIEIEVEEGLTVLQACEKAGFEILSHKNVYLDIVKGLVAKPG